MQRGELAEFEACFTFACPKVSCCFPFWLASCVPVVKGLSHQMDWAVVDMYCIDYVEQDATWWAGRVWGLLHVCLPQGVLFLSFFTGLVFPVLKGLGHHMDWAVVVMYWLCSHLPEEIALLTLLRLLEGWLSMAQVGPLRECQVVVGSASTLVVAVLDSIRRQLPVAYASGMHSGMHLHFLYFSLLAGFLSTLQAPAVKRNVSSLPAVILQWKASRDILKIQKPPATLIYAYIYPYISKISQSIWWPSPFNI